MVLKVGIVGTGVMGLNHARIVNESERAELTMVYDTNIEASKDAARRWNTTAAASIDQLSNCDAVIVASSTQSHESIGRRFVEEGKALLIEKPLCVEVNQTSKLLRLCEEKNTVLLCGFVERFNPAISAALKLIDGPVRHVLSIRHSPYNSRASSGVVTDLLIHDLDLTSRLAPTAKPDYVGASQWTPSNGTFAETVNCTIDFNNQMTTIQSASRWGQRKVREISISTDSLTLELDLIRSNVTAYRHRSYPASDVGGPASYRTETMIEIPFVRHSGEPLAMQFDHFVNLATDFADRAEERRSIEPPHILAELVSSASR
jgi:predicted dehydrogenase